MTRRPGAARDARSGWSGSTRSCRSITGDGVRETLRRPRGVRAARAVRRARRGRRCSTGRSTTSGTCGRPTSPTRPGRRVVDFRRAHPAPGGLQRPGPRHASRSTSCGPTCTRCPTTPTGSPTAPATTTGTGASASPTRQLRRARARGRTTWSSTRRSSPGELTYGELVLPGDDRRGGRRHLARVPSLPGQRQPDRAHRRGGAGARLCGPAVQRYTYRFLFAPGTIGVAHLAQPQPRRAPPDPARAGPHRPGRSAAPWSTSGPGTATRAVDARGRARRRAGAGARCAATRRTATTSGSSTRSASTCRSGGCRARRTGSTPSTTPPPTTCASSPPSSSRSPTSRSLEIVDVLENDATYRQPEPVRRAAAGQARGSTRRRAGSAASDAVMAMLWTLGYSDGSTSLLDIASIAGIDFAGQRGAASALLAAGLLGRAAAA